MSIPSQLDPSRFETYVFEVATITRKHGGSASKLDGYELLPPADAWEFPKYPAKTAILPPDADLVEGLKAFISANEMFLREPDCWLGTWINPQTGCFYLDITTSCPDLEEAKRMAFAASQRDGRRIVAIYNSKHRQTVFVNTC